MNKVEGLEYMTNGYNYLTKKKYVGYDLASKYKYFFVSFYILSGQVFPNSHQYVLNYLESEGFSSNKCDQIIKTIDNIKKNVSLDWATTHDFIQKLINNIISVNDTKNEIELSSQLNGITI